MFHQFLLLAERSPFRDMGSGFRDRREHFDPLELLPWLLVFAVVLAALVVVSRYLNTKDNRRLYNNPTALFRALCRAHELTRADERLLWQVVRFLELEQPAAVFLDPDRFAEAISDQDFRRHQEALEVLAARLFASDVPLSKTLPVAAPEDQGQAAGLDRHENDEDGSHAPEAAADDSAATEDAGPRLSEQHAVRALEALMKQIQAAREPSGKLPAAPPSPPIDSPMSTV